MAPARPSPSARAGALGLAALAALALLYALALRTAAGQRLDDSPLRALDADRAPRVTEATSRLLDTISISSVALLGLAIVAVALVRKRPDLALGAAAIVAGANLTTQILKPTLPRPPLNAASFVPEGSFPSGHVTVAMSLALALLLVVPPTLRLPAAALGVSYAAGVGVAVLALDWHRPSDVLGAELVCVAWTAFVAAGLPLLGPNARRGGSRTGATAGLAGLVAAVLTVAFLVVAAVAVTRRTDLWELADVRASFLVAAVAVAGSAVVLAALTATVLREGAGARARVPRPSG